MPRANPLSASFNAGEISPRLAARTDFIKYAAGSETVENLIPLAEGGLMRRAGTRFVAETEDSSIKGRLKRFEFSVTQAYMLELGDGKMRFYRHQGQIVSGDTDASISNGTFTSGITDWDDRSTGSGSIAHDATNERLSLVPGGATASDIGWAEQDVAVGAAFDTNEHVLKFRVLGAASDRIELRIGTTSTGNEIVDDKIKEVGRHCVGFTPGDGNNTIYVQFRNRGDFRNKTVQIDNVSLIDNSAVEINTPWLEADLPNVSGPQSADVLYLFHPDHRTQKLQRLGNTSWSLTDVAWEDGPWLEINATSTTLLPSAATGLGITLTLSSTEGVNGGQGWLATDIGRLVRYSKAGTAWGYAIITSINSPTVAVADVRADFEAAPTAQTTFRLGAWSGTTGYPSVGGFYEQRLFAANNTDQVQTFWASQTADFENHTPDNRDDANDGTVEDDDALNYTISADNVNAIRWMSPGEDTLVIGTTGGEWVPESAGASLTPSDIVVRRQTTHGSADVDPVRIGSVVLFVKRAARRVMEFGFAIEVDGFRALDMNRIAQHITVGGLSEVAFQENPESLVWSVRGDGQLLSMTYRREEDVVGWGRHIMGGVFSGGNPVVESVAVIPGANGAGQVQNSEDRDEVWVIVKRTINGATKRYVEVFERDWEDGDDEDDAYYADSIITYDSVATTTITGLDHLEGETVKVWADGAIAPDATVSSGSITLDNSASTVQVGLGYTHNYKGLKFEAGAARGTAIGKTKQIFGLNFVVLNSHTLSFGPDSSNLTDIDFRQIADLMDAGVPFFTGEYFSEYDDDWESDPRIVIQSDDPAPFTLLALAPEMDTRETRG